MKTLSRLLLTILALALVCQHGWAQDKTAPSQNAPDKKAKNKKAKNKATPFGKVFAFPKTITLTDDQQKKVDELKKDYTPKLAELKKAEDGVLTEERRKAQQEAITKAKADGKKGKEAKKAGQEALQLNENEKKQLAETKASLGKLTAEIKQKKTDLLTDEQKKAIKPKKKKGDQ